MILAACPGGPTSNLISHLAKGDLALSVSLTAVSSFITILTIPFIVNFALIRFQEEGQVIQLDVMETIIQVFTIVVIPVIVGMLIRKFKERFALRMAKPPRKKRQSKSSAPHLIFRRPSLRPSAWRALRLNNLTRSQLSAGMS